MKTVKKQSTDYQKLMSCQILLFLFSFTFVSNFFFNIGAPMGERFAYLPSLGSCIAIAAVLGIIYLEPILKKFSEPVIEESFKNLKLKKFVKFIFSLLNLTIASQLASLPIMLFSFEYFSLIAPLANIFLTWTLPFILALLILGIFLSWLIPIFSLYFFWPSYLLLNFIFFISEKLAAFQFSALETSALKGGSFKFIFFVIYYFVLILVVRRFNKKLKYH